MLLIDPKPRAMWTYYCEEGDLKDSRRIFLFVYFDQDRFDGYMWFSTLSKQETGGPPLRQTLHTVRRPRPCESRPAAQTARRAGQRAPLAGSHGHKSLRGGGADARTMTGP